MSTIKEFKDQQGGILAYAAIPDHYMIGASLVDKRQHEGVPFFITAHFSFLAHLSFSSHGIKSESETVSAASSKATFDLMNFSISSRASSVTSTV